MKSLPITIKLKIITLNLKTSNILTFQKGPQNWYSQLPRWMSNKIQIACLEAEKLTHLTKPITRRTKSKRYFSHTIHRKVVAKTILPLSPKNPKKPKSRTTASASLLASTTRAQATFIIWRLRTTRVSVNLTLTSTVPKRMTLTWPNLATAMSATKSKPSKKLIKIIWAEI